MYKILVVDDTPSVLAFLKRVLLTHGFAVVTAGGGDEALKIIEAGPIDVVISDIRMEPISGLELLRIIHEKDLNLPVILVTGYEDLTSAASALKNEAFDYLIKPLDIRDLLTVCNRAVAYKRAVDGVIDLALIVGHYVQLGDLVVESQQMHDVSQLIQQYGLMDSSVLVVGERGTGKDMVAREIHNHSSRKDKLFVAVDCAPAAGQVTAGEPFLAMAKEGTLVLEHIDQLPRGAQEQFLAELTPVETEKDEGEIPRVRVLSTSTLDPAGLVEKAGFNKELVSSLAQAVITVPPLRERTGDILPLTYHMFRKLRRDNDATAEMEFEVCDSLEKYSWPGNLDDLEMIVRHVVERGKEDVIRKGDLPQEMIQSAGGNTTLDKRMLREAFMYSEGLKRFLRVKGKHESERLKSAVHGMTTVDHRSKAAGMKKGTPS